MAKKQSTDEKQDIKWNKSIQSENHFAKEIEKHLEEIGMPFEELHKHWGREDFITQKKNFPQKKKEERKWLKRKIGEEEEDFKKRRREEEREWVQKPFDLDFVCHMVMACGIDPNVFLLDKNMQKEWEQWKRETGYDPKNVRYYTKDSPIYTKWGPQKLLKKVLDLDYEKRKITNKEDSNKSDEDFAREYADTVRPYYEEATKSISIVEFLGKGDRNYPGTHLKIYQAAHKLLFCEIRALLTEKKKLRYNRILLLPHETELEGEKNAIPPHIIQIAEALIAISNVAYEHIVDALYTFEDRVIVAVAPVDRPVNYAVVKGESKYVLTEYYRYKQPNKRVLVPDLLFIQECPKWGSELDTMAKIYHREIKKNIDPENKNLQLTKKNIKEMTALSKNFAELKYVGAYFNSLILENMEKKLSYVENYNKLTN